MARIQIIEQTYNLLNFYNNQYILTVLHDGSRIDIELWQDFNRYKIVKESEMSLHHSVIIICSIIKNNNNNLPLIKVKFL